MMLRQPAFSDYRYILPWRFSHENISMVMLPLPLIQEEQLSVCALCTDRLPMEACPGTVWLG